MALFYALGAVLAALVTVGGSSSLLSKTQIRIIGGEPARIGQFPWQVWIEGAKWFFLRTGCGGSLVTEQHVITAAHCVQGVMYYRITLGSDYRFSSVGITIGTSGNSAQAHPSYTARGYLYDIAVILLPRRFTPSNTIMPIKLPEPWQLGANLDGLQVTVSGFGKTADAEIGAHGSLQYSSLRILEHSVCQEYYMLNFGMLIDTSQICTHFTGKISDVCSGDSGGPLVLYEQGEPTLIGVISLGVEPCESGSPSVYTAVAAYLPWINSVIYRGPTISKG